MNSFVKENLAEYMAWKEEDFNIHYILKHPSKIGLLTHWIFDTKITKKSIQTAKEKIRGELEGVAEEFSVKINPDNLAMFEITYL